uniref:Uncharacterized protein n=1 Tax=Panagrolaimus sp. JU765 TaxID=591449 RepID=A0AC34RJ79_9BILA
MKNFFLTIFVLFIVKNIQGQVCRSHIPCAVDISLDLSQQQLTKIKNFLLNPFLDLFPIDIQPNLFGVFTEFSIYRNPKNKTDIPKIINGELFDQLDDKESYFSIALANFLQFGSLNYSSAARVPQNVVVFTGGPIHDKYVSNTMKYVKELTANGNTVTAVFAKPNLNETNYKKIPGLNLVEWNDDSAVLLGNIRKNFYCLGETTPAHPTTTSSTPSSIRVCESHIPFAYDVSQALTSDQYNFEEQMILDPFLATIFPSNIRPSFFGIFDTSAYFPKSRPNNLTDIVDFVRRYPQLSGQIGNIDEILNHLLARNILFSPDGLPVNTIIFTGSELPRAKIDTVIDLAKNFVIPNTLIFVFTKPNINQQNYEAVSLVTDARLIQYNPNKFHMVAEIRQIMECGSIF